MAPMIPNILPGEQKTLTHYHASHGVMTVVYQCMYVLPKHAKVPMADGTQIDLENGLRASKTVYAFGTHRTDPELYMPRTYWAHLQDDRCPLCNQFLDGRGQ